MPTLPHSLLERAQHAADSGPRFWRSLEELAETEDFQERLADEFPEGASMWTGGSLGRRRFLKLLGASLAFAGMTACTRRTQDKILPYVRQPEDVIPGEALYYATAMDWNGFGRGILVEAHMGRPTKIEGNPDHPCSLGATDAITQAAILSLYDPDRSQVPRLNGVANTWAGFENELRTVRAEAVLGRGARLGLFFEPSTSPTFLRQLEAIREQLPDVQLFSYSPLTTETGSLPVRPFYDFSEADLIVSFDHDFLESSPASLRYSRDFAFRRRMDPAMTVGMNRLLVFESTYTLTGAMADERFPMPPDAIIAALRDLKATIDSPQSGSMRHLAESLRARRGRSLITVGEHLPIEAHRLAHAINESLGNIGRTLRYVENPLRSPPGTQDLEALSSAATDSRLDALLVLSGNPVYTAPVDVPIGDAIRNLRWTAHLGLERDETARHCRWHLPQAHFLETWSDIRASDGTATVQQPLIEPLYLGQSLHQVLNRLLDRPEPSAQMIVQETWRRLHGSDNFESFWQQALQDGVVPGSTATPPPIIENPYRDTGGTQPVGVEENAGLWALFRPDPTVGDGRWSANPWLQELPKSLTMLVWDNAAIVAPQTALRLSLSNGDVVRLTLDDQSVEAAVWILPGHDPSSVTIHLGYGRDADPAGDEPRGFNAYRIRPARAPWNAFGLQIEKTNRVYPLVTTQQHHAMEGRHHVISGSVEEYRQNPRFAHQGHHEPSPEESLYPQWPKGTYAWGMTIDLNVCTGCRACVTACQAENNIPVVGKDQVALGREMHWIRVDRYFEGETSAPRAVHQPVPCMHCEKAPCEVVCPVAATVHSNSGLNEMIYNRCVGTRYCSNNCPYKVRRFNFLDWGPKESPGTLQHNPDVTVRMRGVMEKCTYCVQRINQARLASKQEDRRIRDGEVIPACAQACPTEAIVFGDVNDPQTRVSQQKASPRNYGLLAELNTRPRTTYLARLRNEESS